eukprot:GHVS01057970.1.p1 GENE.GHVS01057970.1~~GHVS01057970.1.p1  ORF type:complete len:139 (-),score=16.17 GHVS01057970.1:154-570(-)
MQLSLLILFMFSLAAIVLFHVPPVRAEKLEALLKKLTAELTEDIKELMKIDGCQGLTNLTATYIQSTKMVDAFPDVIKRYENYLVSNQKRQAQLLAKPAEEWNDEDRAEEPGLKNHEKCVQGNLDVFKKLMAAAEAGV